MRALDRLGNQERRGGRFVGNGARKAEDIL